MPASPRKPKSRQGVSIITCTNRRGFLNRLFHNYRRQRGVLTELIIIVNNDRTSLLPYRQAAARHSQVKVFRLPERTSLGTCLNFAVKQSRYAYIAKFDDDDYYSPYYLAECLRTFKHTNADIIGKKAHYMYLQGSRTLLLRFPGDEHRYVSLLPGATLIVKRKVFGQVRFPDQSIGEDDQFCLRSKRKGFRIYSAGRHNFVAIRRKNSLNHTWIISDKTLIAHHKTIPNVRNFRLFAQKKPKGSDS